MFTQTKPLSKFPAYCRPLIQTLRMQNKDNQILGVNLPPQKEE